MNKHLPTASKIALSIIAAFVVLWLWRTIQGAARSEAVFFVTGIAIITAFIGVISQIVNPSYYFSMLATGLSLFAGLGVYIEFLSHHNFNAQIIAWQWLALFGVTFITHLILLLATAYLSFKIRQMFHAKQNAI